MNEDLSPCPMCGKPAVQIEDDSDIVTFYRVACSDPFCIVGPLSSLQGEDVKAWNRLAGFGNLLSRAVRLLDEMLADKRSRPEGHMRMLRRDIATSLRSVARAPQGEAQQ